MVKPAMSERYSVKDFEEALEFPYRKGWTDGLPVVPPTEKRVAEFLDHAGLEPDQTVAEVIERGRVINAEKVAINAVMAGCLPEYMPVLAAALEAMADPLFHFNHLASLGSPWPLIIVNGPIAKEIGLSHGGYLFGPGSRPNATIARALSLVLRNCAEAKAEGIQRGQLGNPIRWCGCIAENEETPWVPLHVQRGLDAASSAVTVVSTYPGSPTQAQILLLGDQPARMLDPVCHSVVGYGGAHWIRGTYVLLVPPHFAEIFIRHGWGKQDVRDYLFDNCRSTIADLKYRAAWGKALPELNEEIQRIQSGDQDHYMYLFKDNGEHDRYLFTTSNVEGRVIDVFVVVAGGNAGDRIGITIPYAASTNPVTRVIRSGR